MNGKLDLAILVVLDGLPAGAPSAVGVSPQQVRGRLAVRRSYDAVREHLMAMAAADTPLVWRRREGRGWLYRISHAGIGELERARAKAIEGPD